MGLSLPKSNLIFLKKCLDKWVHFSRYWKDYPPRTGTVAIKDIIHYVDKKCC